MSSFFILKDRNFQSLRGALHCEFSSLNEVTSPHAVAVTLAKGREQDKAVRAEGFPGEDTGMACVGEETAQN